MRAFLSILGAAVAMTSTMVLAAPNAAAPNPTRAVRTDGQLPAIGFEKYTLPNGLQVILAEDHRLPLVAFNMRFHVGAKDETPGLTGFAHLFEHLMFAGTKHVPRGVADKLVEAAGGTDSNGSTSFDETRYYFTLPSNQLELGLWIKSDMMGFMIDEVDQVALANQQDVVRNERRQSVENRPYGIVEDALYNGLFPKSHPYHAAVIGSHADIQAATLKDVKGFFKTFYRPNNAAIVLAGDFEPENAKKLIAKYFGPLLAGSAAPALLVPVPVLKAEKRLTIQDRVELPRVYLGWHTSPIFKPGDAELDLAAQILGGGKSSRLYKSLVYDKQIAQAVVAAQESLILGSIFTIEATARPGKTADELEKAVDAELAKLAAAPPSEAELARARNTLETRLLGRLEKVMGIAEQLASYNQLAHDPGFLSKDVARYRAVKPEDIRRVVAEQLKKTARVVAVGVPGKQDLGPEVPTPPAPGKSDRAERESVNADAAWRAKQPGAGAAQALVLPVPKSFTLPNGLTVVHVANPGVPVVSATLVVKAGSNADPADRPGLAGFTAAVMQEGTGKRSALELADAVAALGAQFDARAGTDDSRVSITSLAAGFPAALELLAEVVLDPAFAAQEIERQRKSRLGSLVQQHENPMATAGVVAAAALFGPQHPLGKGPLGSEAAIKATTREDLLGFWRRGYRPEQAALVVAGAIGFDELQALVTSRFGGWKADGEAVGLTLPKPAPTAARLVLIDKPGAPQTALQVVSLGPRATDPDVPALSVTNAILGGNFTSRINHKLREVKGYTYGVYSDFVTGRDVGTFVVRGSVRTDVTGPALKDLFAEIDGMRAKAAPAAELAGARNSQLLSLPGMFDTNAVIARSFASAWSRGQGLTYFASLPAKLGRVDARTAMALARKHVLPDRLVVIAVGDKAKIAPQLEGLRSPTEVRDVDGNLVSPDR
jgi:zinc protease